MNGFQSLFYLSWDSSCAYVILASLKYDMDPKLCALYYKQSSSFNISHRLQRLHRLAHVANRAPAGSRGVLPLHGQSRHSEHRPHRVEARGDGVNGHAHIHDVELVVANL